MPIASDPNATYEFILSTDKDKPEAEQAVFVLRYLTCTKWKEVSKMYDAFTAGANDLESQFEAAIGVISAGLVEWENLKYPDGKPVCVPESNLLDILGIEELTELMQAVLAQSVSDEDKKKLESQLPCNTVKSATIAQDPESAGTGQQKPSP